MDTGFPARHPVTTLSYYLSVIVFSMMFLHPAFLLSGFAAAFVTALHYGGQGVRRMFFRSMLPLLLGAGALNALFNPNGVTVLFTFPWGRPVTMESMSFGFALGMMVVTVMLWFSSFHRLMQSDKIIHLFGRSLPSFALLFTMTLRLVPRFTAELRQIREARIGAGLGGEDGKRGRVRGTTRDISVLFSWSLEQAMETADSMRARGYGLPGRSTFSLCRFSRRDVFLLILIALLDAGVITGVVLGVLKASYLPTGDFAYLGELSMAVWAAYLLLGLLPVITDMMEAATWRILRSRR